MATETGSLSFWRVKRGSRPRPTAVYETLRAGGEPDELEDLDTRKVMAAIRKQYPEAEREGKILAIDLEDEQAGIEVSVSKKHVHFDFYGDAFRQMDRVVEAMRSLGLPCYDASARKMYPLDKPPRFAMTPEESAPLDAMFESLGKQADKARTTTSDPQERLKMLKAFMDSGDLQREMDKRAQKLPAAKPQRKNQKRKR